MTEKLKDKVWIEGDRPWFKSYTVGPFDLARTMAPYPEEPLGSVLDNSAAKYPDNIALVYFDQRMTYKELKRQADCLANALAGLDVKKGDRVAVLLPSSPQFAISDFGILKAGATGIPLSALMQAPELEHILNESGAETIICDEELLDLVRSVEPKTKLKNIIVASPEDYTSEETETPKKIEGTHSFRELIATHKPEPPKVEFDPTEDLAYVYFTGGATGMPKGVMLTHFNVLADIVQVYPWSAQIAADNFGPSNDASIVAIPLYHIYGHWAYMTFLYFGSKVVVLRDPRDIDLIEKHVEEEQPYALGIVPTQLMKMREKGYPKVPVLIYSGGSMLPSDTAEAVEKKTNLGVSEGYGLTETSSVSHWNPAALARSFGFTDVPKRAGIGVPIVDTDVKIMNLETGKECDFGEPGEMHIKGPQVMKGYWPTPGNGLVDGWLPTGDIVKMDADGYCQVVDRVKDMANVSGLKVYTNIIDNILYKHPAVASAATIGIPDPERAGSERIKAFIKLREGYEGKVTADDIIEHCKKELPPYSIPKSIEFRDNLPMTLTEKLFKRQLKEEEVQKMKDEGLLK